MKYLLPLFCLAFASGATAQIVPVDIGAGVSWPIVGMLAIVGAVVVGLIYWHRKNPTQEAAALAQAHSDMAMIAAKAAGIAERATDALGAMIAKWEHANPDPTEAAGAQDGATPGQASENAPQAVPGPSPEQLAAVAAARQAYLDALGAAGMVSPPGGE